MTRIAGLILAGGQALRMGGGDKAFVTLGGTTLLQRSIATLSAQCDALAISANGDPARYAEHDLPVLPDTLPQRQGPLAGILAGMEWAAQLGVDQLFTAPVDTPFLPADVVARLAAHAGDVGLAIAASPVDDQRRLHPVVGVWPVRLAAALRDTLSHGERRVGRFAQANGAVVVPFDGDDARDPFFNINTPDDLAAAQAVLDQ
ncbi:molybdenum cofactor guanylyltransferase MobA [Celeribacter sp.]|uniref:molybdenum cofactor guanylyltransferase MobA n=1 Tax=Celeribacter sp. TaxID=1890673 RepID=UPI003A8FDA9E